MSWVPGPHPAGKFECGDVDIVTWCLQKQCDKLPGHVPRTLLGVLTHPCLAHILTLRLGVGVRQCLLVLCVCVHSVVSSSL